ncbi:hypothetical protein FA13DRAFT_1392834 [Coprinellus micaceus]|uniref:Uncharacterized protein n=1 Tax=Coprinellus micaceus TaxID=71717 RepID=A0A4Y7SQJ1_COPMI|nr:hypothetical protein FA13DRAFT_1392834 [Coprinellus micaceus]
MSSASDRSLATSSLPIISRSPLTTADTNLLSLLISNASWVWFPEDTTTLPVAPTNEQRAFRKSYVHPKDKGTPKNATIIVAADDYYALYVDGVLAHEADPSHTWEKIEIFSIPLPVATIGGQATPPGPEMLLGFRVVNLQNTAGLLAAIQVNFDSGQSDTFYTGLDQTWLSERFIQENWEQPWFETTPHGKRWSPATVFTKSERDPSREGLSMPNREVTVLGQLTLSPASSGSGSSASSTGVARVPGTAIPIPGSDGSRGTPCGSDVGGIWMSTGAFAGTIAGSAVLSLVLGALVAILVMQRVRSRSKKPASSLFMTHHAGYSGYSNETTPGRPLYGQQ